MSLSPWSRLSGRRCAALKCLRWETAQAGFASDGLAPNALLALSHRTLSALSARELLRREGCRVARGDALRARRLSGAGKMFALAFRLGRLQDFFLLLPIVICSPTTGCSLKCSGMKRVKAEVNLAVAQLGDCAAQVLAAVPVGGGELAFVFADPVRSGTGDL